MRTLTTLLLLGILAGPAAAQSDFLSRQNAIKEKVAKHHVAAKPLNDAFSAAFFDRMLATLDEERLFFTAADLKSLGGFRTTIDEDWNNGSAAFFSALSPLYKNRLQVIRGLITEICAKPFDFSAPEVFSTTDTAAAFNDKVLYNRWRLLLKSEVLRSLANVALNQWQTKGALAKADVLLKEGDMRARVKTKYLARLNAFAQHEADYNRQLSLLYFNTFLSCFDPHSTFFDADGRRQFSEGLNTEGLAFGFSLDENERGETCIDRIAPGSAAWQSGMLNRGDVPVQLKWEGATAVDLTGMEEADVSALLAQHTKEKMELTVRKGNGQQQTVVLRKQKLANEDNTVKSYVLAGKQNIGYVMLPSFYTEWEDNTGSRCAADVAREIVKLKKDSLAGLILDLRFNGGGSLAEAIELAGIFIDEGVVCQVRDKNGKAEAMKDVNRGVIYNGPMLVLVNGQSASASEVVAAALQDHQRAIIAGSPTFGKATGQQIFPLQEGGTQGNFVKLTDIRIYRPTGQTAQRKGVQPDVTLPDVYGLTQREADEAFALLADTVAANKYFRAATPLALGGLQQKSTARLAVTPKFTEAKRLAAISAAYQTNKQFSLKWDDVEKEIKALPPTNAEALFNLPTALYRVRNNTVDLPFASSGQEYNDFWLKRLSNDFYVEEAFQILLDFRQSK